MRSNKGPSQRASVPLELIHSDLCGPMPEPSISGYRYFIIYVDDFTRYTWIYFLKTKTSKEIGTVFQYFKSLVENQVMVDNQAVYHRIKRLRSDNGRGEYDNT